MKLEGKVALISGVSQGIGGAIARAFAAEGASVICTGARLESWEPIVQDIAQPDSVVGHPLDVTDEGQWADCVALAIEKFGGLDIVVNNAGILLLESIGNTTLEAFQKVMRINVDGVFLGMKAAIGAMEPGGASGRGGCIINISSVSAGTPFPDHAAYGTSKAAVSGLTRHVAKECVESGNGIRVNAIAPGVVRTPMLVTNA